MNTKKIWLWSLVLGGMVALVAYFTMLPKPASVATSGDIEQASENNNESDDPSLTEEEIDFNREMGNPMVEVETGKRAISIYVEIAPGVSGYVEPESKVDVIAYETTEDKKKEEEYKSAVLVLENVKVLSSGRSADTKEEALHYQTVTLEVTPEEGVMLGLASKDKDGFYLMLRNEDDTETGKKGYKETRKVVKEEKKEDKE
ncbi:Flp pilus assembly protein CpaB [Mesobacillus persicus]|uniref:Flp pilus assembly protein CpaB n=1 Tax=Mesobacillus persicus TaxID=930146 RepID=A0A1H8CG10_9BACI|nr:Flp pilus assembly protein CpaB [Mesobacillus persicus]SEM94211.1 Flp pilus assembly protein CpaB [Mesobacillus persicus]